MFWIVFIIFLRLRIRSRHNSIALILGNRTIKVSTNPMPIVYSGIFQLSIFYVVLDNCTIGPNLLAKA